MLSDTQLQEFRDRLHEMKEELSSLSQSTQEERKPVQLDQQSVGRLSRMDALQEQAMQLETERRRQLTLARIEAALLRLTGDEFGYCVSCGEEVSVARLEHDPSVTACVSCARKS